MWRETCDRNIRICHWIPATPPVISSSLYRVVSCSDEYARHVTLSKKYGLDEGSLLPNGA